MIILDAKKAAIEIFGGKFGKAEKILVEEENALQARLFLISAVRQVVFNGLTILGISAPETM